MVEETRSALIDRFVTGDWSAAPGGGGGAEDGDEDMGGFEDLETGQVRLRARIRVRVRVLE